MAGLGGLTAAIAARADDSAQDVRIADNAKQILFFPYHLDLDDDDLVSWIP